LIDNRELGLAQKTGQQARCYWFACYVNAYKQNLKQKSVKAETLRAEMAIRKDKRRKKS